MGDWTRELARSYAACRAAHPEQRTLVVCDLDGTVLERSGPGPSRPSRGVVDALRWFAAQPLTDVAVVADRAGSQRGATLAELDEIGREYRMSWDPDLVHLRTDGAPPDPVAHRLGALRRWSAAGHHVAAVLDGDAQVIDGLARSGEAGGALLVETGSLLADRRHRPGDPGGGHVELVWHEVNDPVRIRQFLASPMRWAELDLRLGPGGDLALRHDDFATGDDGDDAPDPRAVLTRMREAGKGVNLDIKDPAALDAAVAAVGEAGIGDADLWLNGRIDKLGERALRGVARAHPDARVQCPVEFLGPLVATMPRHAHAVVDQLVDWGVGRFSVAWTNPHRDLLLDNLDAWGSRSTSTPSPTSSSSWRR